MSDIDQEIASDLVQAINRIIDTKMYREFQKYDEVINHRLSQVIDESSVQTIIEEALNDFDVQDDLREVLRYADFEVRVNV